jgi:hypothetical protein
MGDRLTGYRQPPARRDSVPYRRRPRCTLVAAGVGPPRRRLASLSASAAARAWASADTGSRVRCSAMCSPSTIIAATFNSDRSRTSSSARAISVAVTNRRQASAGEHPIHHHPSEQVITGERGEGIQDHLAIPGPRCRDPGTRRAPNVTELGALPWRTAARPGLCLPFGPARPVISACIIADITFRPVATLIASKPFTGRHCGLAQDQPHLLG